MRGLYNFDRIRIDYYRDANAMFEAFKAGLIDFLVEDDAARWLSSYDFPAAREKRILKVAADYALPKGVEGFAFNARRWPFSQPARSANCCVHVRFRVDQRATLWRGSTAARLGFFDGSELPRRSGRLANVAEARAARKLFPRRG